MKCRVCDSTRTVPAIDLGSQPWCNNFLRKEEVGRERFYPLRVLFCENCRTPQLDYTVPKEVMFGDHTYVSGTTRSLGEHFRAVAGDVDSLFSRDRASKSVLDIGSNDGTQLRCFKALGYDILGIECSKRIAQMANDAGIVTVNDFFNLDLARRLGRRFDVINAAGVFFHLEELHSATDGIVEVLAPDGVFVVQFLYMKSIVENGAFDQIYHEHLLYYNLANIEVLLNRHGLAMFDAYLAPIHGGSIVGFVGHRGRREPSDRLMRMRQAEVVAKSNELATYREFAQRIERMREENLAFLDEAKRQGKRICGLGAPAKGNTLLNTFRIGIGHLDCLVERNALRRGLFSPGMHIPVVMEEELVAFPDIYYVLAWNFKKEILMRSGHLLDRVRFYFPVNPAEGTTEARR